MKVSVKIALAITIYTLKQVSLASVEKSSDRKFSEESNFSLCHSDLRIQDIALEPKIRSPVAFDWGSDGKLWIVEMCDYPSSNQLGAIKSLRPDNTGIPENALVAIDHLKSPNGICEWRDGMILSTASKIVVAHIDGSPSAIRLQDLFSGFTPGNPQHNCNGFDYGLDNWIYGANGDNGGTVHPFGTKKSIRIDGADFRFRPDTLEFEPVSGASQYGRHRDDWGNWFGNHNVIWLSHYFAPRQYLQRNRYLQSYRTTYNTADYVDSGRLYPRSPIERFGQRDVGHVTAACSPMPYRDELFGPEFENSVFICEPAYNLVHREVLEPFGVTFRSHRAATEQTNEFLASTDSWFRPVMVKTGPDGALYVLDMHRKVIDHPDYIPAAVRTNLDFRAGADMGRLYRIYPKGVKLRTVPRFDTMKTLELVAALESPNGWQRDTAQRLLYQSQDKAAIPALQKLIITSPRPKTRLQAMCTLDGLNGLTRETILRGLNDPDFHVREHAVRLSEQFLKPSATNLFVSSERSDAEMKRKLVSFIDDPEIRVRYQLAFSLGEWMDERASEALVKIAVRDQTNDDVQVAVMSSVPGHVSQMLHYIFSQTNEPPVKLTSHLVGYAVWSQDAEAIGAAVGSITHSQQGDFAGWQLAGVGGFLDAVEERRTFAKQYRSANGAMRVVFDSVDKVIDYARSEVTNDNVSLEKRTLCVRLLGRGLHHDAEDLKLLQDLLLPTSPERLQQAALNNLRKHNDSAVGALLVSNWNTYLPAVRTEVLNLLVSRWEWARALLNAVQSKTVPIGDIPVTVRDRLLRFRYELVSTQAKRVFGSNASERQKIVEKYKAVSGLPGDARAGAAIFSRNCASCHALSGQGVQVGPDLASVAKKSAAELSVSILDPNAAIEPRYVAYSVITKDQRELFGVIASETENVINLRKPGGATETLSRSEVVSVQSSKRSLMPEGFESAISVQQMADLIAYIKSSGLDPFTRKPLPQTQ